MPDAVFTDFDGTLSSIVSDPARAVAVPGAIDALSELVDAGIAVHVISGRPVSFLQDRLGLEHVVYRGVHGRERAEGLSEAAIAPSIAPSVAILEGVLDAVRSDLEAIPGALIEPKGSAFAVHYRNAESVEEANDRIARILFGACNGLDIQLESGRKAWEVAAGRTMNKGRAVVEELAKKRFDRACFLGDDVSDLSAFAALAGAREVASATCVVVSSAETPGELLAAADLVLDSPAEAVAYLRSWPVPRRVLNNP